jgi:ATP-dependent RNA helicase DHX8/PRP22
VHPSSVLSADNDGMMPNYVVYHELISTTRPFMRNVCAVDMAWVAPIKRKIEKLNVRKLSGGPAPSFKVPEEKTELSKNNAETPAVSENVESRIEAARERFLARKGQK